MNYWEAKCYFIGRWRVICVLLSFACVIVGGGNLYLTGFFTRSWYNESTAALFFLFIITSVLSAIWVTKPIVLDTSDDAQYSLLTLWWKRKKLEHMSRIKELENR